MEDELKDMILRATLIISPDLDMSLDMAQEIYDKLLEEYPHEISEELPEHLKEISLVFLLKCGLIILRTSKLSTDLVNAICVKLDEGYKSKN